MATNAKTGNKDLVAMLQSQTKQDKGLGYMWG